jgi:anhydro-N-acetylmuramic acid kinase
LASFLHWTLCANAKKDTIVLNIGGIANVTFIPKKAPLSQVVAFDTGPGNMVIDSLVRHFSRGRVRFDPHGTWAKRGHAHESLLRSWMNHRYFCRRPPKTAGREEFGWDRVKDFLEGPRWQGLSRYDWVATATAWTAYSVEDQIRRYTPKGFEADKMIVGGGGSRNPTLMNELQKRFPEIKVASFESIGWDSDAIEAIAFALLAYEAYHRRSNHLPQVTGAARSCILGKFIPGVSNRRGAVPA